MATIKGFELRQIEVFRTPEHEGFSASLFYQGEKIGQVLDPGGGQSWVIQVDEQADEARFKASVQSYFEANSSEPFYQEVFLHDLFELQNLEHEFLHCQKMGYQVLLDMKFTGQLEADGTEKQPITIACLDEELAKEEVQRHQPTEFVIFKALEDFIRH